jgi:hypothetical protein
MMVSKRFMTTASLSKDFTYNKDSIGAVFPFERLRPFFVNLRNGAIRNLRLNHSP